jgi:transcriptional regulator with GAF, ATPase, and Fis domain/Tfp pilus assembly protein PilF
VRAIAWNEIAVCCFLRGDLDRSRDYLERALPLVRGKDPLYEALVLAHIAIVERKKGQYARALELREQSDEIRRRLGQSALLANSALERAILLKRLGRVSEALRLVEWAIDENQALGREQASGSLVLERGTLLECQGDFAGAAACYEEGARIVEANGDRSNLIVAHFMLGELAVRRRDWERAAAEYARGRAIAEVARDPGSLLVARRNEGFLLAERGETSAALALLGGVVEELMGEPQYEWAPEAMMRLAFVQIAAGQLQAARQTLAVAERILKTRPNALVESLHARASAELLARDGQVDLALTQAKRAVVLSREVSEVFESACALVLAANLEMRLGRHRRARSALLEAREIFATCGLRDREAEIEARIGSLGSGDAEGGENFEAICRVMETVAAIREPDRLLATMLDLAIDHVNAERGFVVLYGGGGREDLEIRAAREISSESAAELARVSRRILAMAGQESRGIISERAVEDARFRDAPSVVAHNVLSVICAPLRVTGRTLGFVYVDNRRRTSRFTPADAAFLEAFAAQTAFALERAHEIQSLETALRETRSEEILIGKSPAIQRVLQLIDSAAHVDHLPVHITGENGTGKELAATLIQKRGQRRDKPFIRVNCAAFSETLIESELFGHEKGAFTGAGFARAGIFERADGGTLFLDEIGEIPESVQLKLLRVLQEFTLTRVGGQKEIRVDVRIISATNADLERRIQTHAFRADLYYRLQGLQIQLPPLRERLSDVPDLVAHFLRGYERTYRKGPLSITPDAMDVLRAYPWPGNVRQLDRELHQALALALPRGNLIRREDFSSTILAGNAVPPRAPDRKSIREHVERAERDVLIDALTRTRWNRSRAAKLLHCSEALVRKKIRKYKLSRPQ